MFQPYLPVENGAREERGFFSYIPLFFSLLLRDNSHSYIALIYHMYMYSSLLGRERTYRSGVTGGSSKEETSSFLLPYPYRAFSHTSECVRTNRDAVRVRRVNEM